MKLRSLLFLFLTLASYILSPASTKAIEPFAPYSVEGNPSDEYQLESFFPLLRFIQPEKLIVYENQDQNRSYQDLRPCGDTRPDSCSTSQTCHGIIQYCDGSGQVVQKRNVGGTCTGLDPSDSESTGTCSYPQQNPTIYVDPQSTDFSRNPDPASDTPNLSYPKYQNEALRYQNAGGNNTITWGSHFLTFNRCERASHQLITAYQAYETHDTVKSGQWPLGWVDWGFVTRYKSKTLLEVWNLLASAGLEPIARDLVNAQDSFFLSLGQDSTTLELPNFGRAQTDLCTRLNQASPQEEWVIALELLPLYPPSFRQGYVRTSICVWGNCKPGQGSDAGQGLYADTSVHSALSAAFSDLLQQYPLAESSKYLNDLAKINPLIRYMMISKKIATPTAIASALDPLSDLSPFTFSTLGHVYDYQTEMDKYGYTLSPSQTQQEGGAFPGSFVANAINFVYGIVDAIAPVSNHLLSIPEPMGQAIFQIQKPVYDTRDTTQDLKDKYVETISNVIDGGSILLYAAKGLGPGDAKRRLAYFTCQDPEYSAPQETRVKDYALGTRIGCYENPAPSGTCDGVAFGKIIEGSSYTAPLTKADSAFSSIKSKLTPELINIYGAAAATTGVPCEVLAGIHYVEADLDPQGSLVSGRPLGTPEPDAGNQVFNTLLETAVYAGNHLKGKMSGATNSVNNLITALSRYNGGGNSNCQAGYPYPIPYTGCPRDFEGEDDIYPMNWIDDKHSTMYLLYCEDLVACEPAVWERMGALTFAVEMYNNMTKDGSP